MSHLIVDFCVLGHVFGGLKSSNPIVIASRPRDSRVTTTSLYLHPLLFRLPTEFSGYIVRSSLMI